MRHIPNQTILNFEDHQRHEVGEVSMEKLMLRSERNDSFGRRVLLKIAGLFAHVPELTFDKEDVDQRIVQQLLKHDKLLQAMDDWIMEPNRDLLPKLREALRVLAPIQKMKWPKELYRGFNVGREGQDTMGLQRAGWFGPKPVDLRPGDKFSYVPEWPLSFTHHEGTAKSYGKVVVRTDVASNRRRLLPISNEMIMALTLRDSEEYHNPQYYMTYGEFILVPDGKPVNFVVDSRGEKKA